MAETFNSPRITNLATELASATGEDIETAVVCALEERLARLSHTFHAANGAGIDELFDRLAKMPVRDGRSPDEILGYDRNGLPR